jgi:hypothetical protein
MQDQGVMNPSSGFGSNSRIGGSNFPLGSGSVNMKFGGGNTPSNPGAYNYGTLGRSIGNAVESVKWGFDTRNKLRDYKDQQVQKDNVKAAKEWNTEVLPVQRAAFAKEQADFNQPRSPATGKPSKAKNAKPMFGPVKPAFNLNPVKP